LAKHRNTAGCFGIPGLAFKDASDTDDIGHSNILPDIGWIDGLDDIQIYWWRIELGCKQCINIADSSKRFSTELIK